MNDQEFGDYITELVQMRDTLTPEDFANRVVALSSELTIARNAKSRARLATVIDAKLDKVQVARGRRPGRPSAAPVHLSLPEPECRHGYTIGQVRDMLGSRFEAFCHWMRGRTMSMCDDIRYNYETGKSEPSGCGPHGTIIYRTDVEQFLAGGEPLD